MISCAMISWCEGQTIDLALKGITGLADEVIIADSGSFDGTQDIAREWIDKLNLSGEVIDVEGHSLGQIRIKSYEACSHPWILLIDSNLVLSNAINARFKRLAESKPNAIGCVRSLNLMGDYEHYFRGLPIHAPHASLFRKNNEAIRFTDDRDRPTIRTRKGIVSIEPVAVNLSRVRPAWRCWYRGEPFDEEHYVHRDTATKKKTGFATKTNRQNRWNMDRQHKSLVEYVEETQGLSLENVKRIAPQWYLEQLNRYALPLTKEMRGGLPEAIKTEQRDPRYKLVHRNGIIGRLPEL